MTIEQLTAVFQASKGQLKSYILRITASVADAEDIMQDTYLKANINFNHYGNIFRNGSKRKSHNGKNNF